MHSGRCAGVPLNKLRQLPRAGMGGVGGIFVNTDSDESGGEEEGRRRRGARGGSTEEARAEVEQRIIDSAWDGLGGGSSVFLRAVGREGWNAVLVYGRRAGGDSGGGEDGGGCGARGARVAAVSNCLRVEGVHGGWVREARVGRESHCGSLYEVHERLLVRRLCYSPYSSGYISYITNQSIHDISYDTSPAFTSLLTYNC